MICKALHSLVCPYQGGSGFSVVLRLLIAIPVAQSGSCSRSCPGFARLSLVSDYSAAFGVICDAKCFGIGATLMQNGTELSSRAAR